MTIHIAHKTLDAIDNSIEKDQGSSFRGWLGKVIPHIGDAYREGEEPFRTHLGASILGNECARAVWYNFRWATRPHFNGRMMRLFNRGHLEEARFIACLLSIGVQVYQQDENGKQYRISFAEGHAGGSGDGVGVNLPDLTTGVPALLEFKTHSEKSFIELAGKLDEWRKFRLGKGNFTGQGVRVAKFEHYVQMNLYMRKMGLSCALYGAVCKNTDDLYMEIVTLDTDIADRFLDRGDRIVWLKQAPKKLNESQGFFKCRFCDHRAVCHLKHTPDVNCRTCAYSEPIAGAKWFCNKHMKELSKENQFEGCGSWTVGI